MYIRDRYLSQKKDASIKLYDKQKECLSLGFILAEFKVRVFKKPFE